MPLIASYHNYAFFDGTPVAKEGRMNRLMAYSLCHLEEKRDCDTKT